MFAQQKKHPFDFKTQYGLDLNLQDDEIVVNFFCDSSGAGLEIGLSRTANVAKNHSPQAISMHAGTGKRTDLFPSRLIVDPSEPIRWKLSAQRPANSCPFPNERTSYAAANAAGEIEPLPPHQ